ncbi:MAG: (2Fe-2S) ferredoxin domain-containing protein, partial [Bacillota bacterium]|nr:(2Fe-2S) ferredoxin domain-containing protein [Bacillota bacterium]
CVGSSCYIKGAHAVAECFQELIVKHKVEATVELKGTFCLDRCKEGVAVTISGQNLMRVTPETAREAFVKYILTDVGVR